MGDFVALVLCIVVAGCCFRLMCGLRCRHDEVDWLSGRCWNCGKHIRRIMVDRHQGVDPRPLSPRRTARNYSHPFHRIQLEYYMIPAPADSPYTCLELERLGPDNSPEMVEVYNTMVGRR